MPATRCCSGAWHRFSETRTVKILLTGGSGMVGSAILRAASGSALQFHAPLRADLDLCSASAVASHLRSGGFDAVLHCAGRVGGIQANIGAPYGFLHDNARINLGVIEGALQAGIQRLLYLGTSCMYPRDYRQPLREDDLLAAKVEPTNEGYALAKILGAKLCELANVQHGVTYKTLIPPNLYGPGDHFTPERSHLVAAVLHKLHVATRGGEAEVEVWGDGSARREFLFCEDLAEYCLVALQRLDDLPDCLNVGCGQDHSVLEYYQAAASVVGFEGGFSFDLSKPLGMRRKLLDSSRAAAFGWRPGIGLADGLERTYRWYLEHVESS